MEQHKANLERQGKTLGTDSATRMSQPPSRRAGYDDWGSDFQRKERGGPSKARDTKPFSTLASEDSFTLDDSFDELDLIGSQLRRDSQQHKASSSKLRNPPIQESHDGVSFVVDGRRYKPHPDYQYDGKRIPKTLKFNKKKKDDGNSEPPASSVVTKDPAGALHNTTRSSTRRSPEPRSGPIRDDPLRRAFKPPTRISNKTDSSHRSTSLPTKKSSSLMPQLDEDYDKTPRASKVQPRPLPVKAEVPVSLFEDEIPTTSWGITAEEEMKEKGKAKAAPWPMDDMSPLKESVHPKAKQDCLIDRLSPLKERNNIRPFPLDKKSPTKGENGATHRKDKKRTIPILPSDHLPSTEKLPSSRLAQSFPELSLLSSPAKPPSSSTQGSQRSSQASLGRKSGKGKAKASRRLVVGSSDESQSETDSVRSRNNIRPFPLGTQMLDGIDNTSIKRGSPDTEEDNFFAETRQKKRARGADEILRELMHSDGVDDEDEDDLLFNDPDLDPARLCPWCDELMPPTPSPHLEHLASAARARSSPDSRPTNPLGLYAPPTVFINVCQRHRFESHQVPLAQQRGWPLQIAWDELAERVRRLKQYLQLIVTDIDEDFIPGREKLQDDDDTISVDGGDDDSILDERPRKGSTFWREVVRSVRQKGARKAAGVRGQMTTFSKTQPGYYGELGSVIISQTIYDLFPPGDFPPASTLPLTPTEFIQRVLVPEAALRLVMDDMRQSRKEAITTLRDSAQYGVAMFPDDHAEGFPASEEIVKARAAARRKVLLKEDEEEEEDAMWSAFPEVDIGDVGPGKLSRAPSAASVQSNRPRRACAVRAQSIIDSESGSDVSMASSRASTTSKSAKLRANAGKAKKTPTGGRSNNNVAHRTPSVEIVSEPDAPPKRGPRPRPKSRTPNPDYFDTDLNLRTSDAEPWSDAPPLSQQIRFGADGKAKKRSKDDKDWQIIDFQTTPKAKRVSRVPSGSKSSFAHQITKTRGSPR